jgi:peptidase E
MTKYILVGGYVHKALDGGKAFCEELIKGFKNKPVKILDCMFARKIEAWDETLERDQVFFKKFVKDFELELADPNNFTEQVKHSDIIYLRGGHTQLLMELLSKNLDWTKELNGKVLAGTSAGGDVIAKYYTVLKTKRIGEGLSLLPIKFIPHWDSDYSDEEASNINWKEELNKIKHYKEDLPIYTLKEGQFKVFDQ